MIGATVRGLEPAQRGISRAAAALPSAMASGVAIAAAAVERDLKQKALTGGQRRDPFLGTMGSDPASGQLGVRTGAARRSIVSRVFQSGRDVIATIGSPLNYLRVQEEGGSIQGSPYLRIPLAAAQTAAGQDRLVGASARQLPGGFIFRSKSGELFIATSDRGRLELHYLLKRSVRLRGRHAFRESAKRMRATVRSLIAGRVSIALRIS